MHITRIGNYMISNY